MKKSSDSRFGRKIKLPRFIIICLILMAATAAVTYAVIMGGFGSRAYFADAKKYVEIEKIIEENYVEKADAGDLYDAAAASMVRSLDDKWSYYMSAEEYESYKLSSANEYAGIGINISVNKKGDFSIVSVDPGTPAEKAGLAAGMTILAVDDTEVKGMSISEVQTLIRSNLNKDFKMTLSNDGSEMTVTLECKILYKNPVSSKMLSGKVGYLKISNFEAGCSEEVIKAIEQLISAGAESFLFDVRDNPGGLLSELNELLDYILPDGDIFIKVDREGKESVTKSDKVCLKYKMAVLVNENTYSAAEFFAAALQEYNWATIVGEQTTGKARSQINIELPDGGAVHISTNKYLTPKHVDLSDAGGVKPDIVVKNNAEDDGDTQLKKALKVLGQ